jgi:hypothetical protein
MPALSLTDQLREFIRGCGKTISAIAEATKIPQPMLSRFLNGKDMRMMTASKLATYLGLELRPILSPPDAEPHTRAMPTGSNARRSPRRREARPRIRRKRSDQSSETF